MAEKLVAVVVKLTRASKYLTTVIETKNNLGELEGAYGFGWGTRDSTTFADRLGGKE